MSTTPKEQADWSPCMSPLSSTSSLTLTFGFGDGRPPQLRLDAPHLLLQQFDVALVPLGLRPLPPFEVLVAVPERVALSHHRLCPALREEEREISSAVGSNNERQMTKAPFVKNQQLTFGASNVHDMTLDTTKISSHILPFFQAQQMSDIFTLSMSLLPALTSRKVSNSASRDRSCAR